MMREENTDKLASLEKQIHDYSQKNSEGLKVLQKDLVRIEQATNEKWRENSEKLTKLETRVSAVEQGGTTQELADRLSNVEKLVSSIDVDSILADTKAQLKKLQDQFDKQDKLWRQQCITLRGVEIKDMNVLEGVEKFFRENFNLVKGIEEASQLGNSGDLYKVKFANPYIKKKIMEKKGAILKGTKISIRNDLTAKEQHEMKILREVANRETEAGNKARVVGARIQIGNKWLRWDSDSATLLPVPNRPNRLKRPTEPPSSPARPDPHTDEQMDTVPTSNVPKN